MIDADDFQKIREAVDDDLIMAYNANLNHLPLSAIRHLEAAETKINCLIGRMKDAK